MKLLLPISFIIISGVLFFSVLNPLYGDVSKLRADLVTYNTALDNSTQLQKTRDALVDKYKNIKQVDKDRLENFLPNTVNNIKFILEVEQLANLHNMSLTGIKFDTQSLQNSKTGVTGTVIAANDPSASLAYGTFPIEFTTQGDYATFLLFLKDVEHNLRLVDVKSVNFIVPSSVSAIPGGNSNVYTYTLKVDTYWLK